MLVRAQDPKVQEAENHDVKTIQLRYNTLFPFELQEILHGKANVINAYDFSLFFII